MRVPKDFRLNIAALCVGTYALGPGFRSVVWVQGCPFNCVGCLSPDWIPIKPAHEVSIPALVETLLSYRNIDGLTFSGGEPFLQAEGLDSLIRAARKRRELNLIVYTGFKIADLRKLDPKYHALDLLDQTDVLIDGNYIRALDDNRGMRGSSNQRIHYLTDRLKGVDFENSPRETEIHVRDGELLFVGVPPHNITHHLIQQERLFDNI